MLGSFCSLLLNFSHDGIYLNLHLFPRRRFELEVPLLHIYKFNGQNYVKIQALKFDIKNGVAKFK